MISAGAYWGRRADFRAVLPRRPAFSLERDVLPTLAGSGLYAAVMRGPFVDIGVPEDYRRAEVVLA